MEDVRLDAGDEGISQLVRDRLQALGVNVDEPDEEASGGNPASSPPKFGFQRLDDLVVNRKCNWLIKDVMPARGTMIMYGAPGSGKSFLALDAALHLACGEDWLGHRVRKPAGVVYVAAEGCEGFRHRAVAARDRMGMRSSVPFALITAMPDLGTRGSEDCNVLRDEVVRQSEEAGFRPALIVFDTLSRCMGNLDESRSEDMNLLVRRLSILGDGLGASVLVVHHSGKDASRGIRGSSTLPGAADAIFFVSRDPETDARTFSVEKMKDGRDGTSQEFSLAPVDLGPDEDGDPITSCVVEPGRGDGVPKSGTGAPTAGSVTSRPAERPLAVAVAVATLSKEEGREAPAGSSAPTGVLVVDEARMREQLRNLSFVSKSKTPDVARVTMTRAVDSAVERGWIGRSDDGKLVWLTDAGKLATALPGANDVKAAA